ncbi:MAG: hypothetical protein P2A85_06645 [Microcoleus anatoxicus]|uniref:hypothetical protein n=1 Tax=Microcoleus anatoxicus TaxID=2705319 RepID=UPI003672D336
MRRSPFYLTQALQDRGDPATGENIHQSYYTESYRIRNLPWRHDRILHASSSVRLVSAPDKIYIVRSP